MPSPLVCFLAVKIPTKPPSSSGFLVFLCCTAIRDHRQWVCSPTCTLSYLRGKAMSTSDGDPLSPPGSCPLSLPDSRLQTPPIHFSPSFRQRKCIPVTEKAEVPRSGLILFSPSSAPSDHLPSSGYSSPNLVLSSNV